MIEQMPHVLRVTDPDNYNPRKLAVYVRTAPGPVGLSSMEQHAFAIYDETHKRYGRRLFTENLSGRDRIHEWYGTNGPYKEDDTPAAWSMEQLIERTAMAMMHQIAPFQAENLVSREDLADALAIMAALAAEAIAHRESSDNPADGEMTGAYKADLVTALALLDSINEEGF